MSDAITRRTVIAGTLTTLGAAAVAQNPANTPVRPRNFVLVHGGWHGGWCWQRVADRLRQRGHVVFTPTLTGLGERSHLLDERIGLDTHVRDIANVIQWEGIQDVVLVGHSYGGCVISGVAERSARAIGALVFLDAFLPDNGQSVADLASPAVRDGIQAASARGDKVLPPIPAASFKVNSEADRAWVDSRCTPHPLRSLTDKISVTGARERIARKAYIRATGYPSPSFEAAFARVRADRAWRTAEIPCGHDAMVDMPDRLVEILLTVSA
jgi:pimeloyl-ACP methyl ester carboxylesterase